MLEQVREASAQVFRFVNAPGFDPGLHTGHGGTAVFLNDDPQAVFGSVQVRALTAG